MINETLYDIVLRLKRETNGITMNPTLDDIDLEKIRSFETTALENPFYKGKLKTIRENLKNVDYIFSPKYNSALDAYNELLIFEYLNTKVEIQFVKEIKGIKTPDYKLTMEGTDSVFADLKTLHFFAGNNNYIDVQNQSAANKIAHEKEIRKKEKGVTFSEPTIISPFRKGDNGSHYNINQIIEDIIDKITTLLKLPQINYQDKKGILIIDTSHIGLWSDFKLGIPVYEGSLYKELNSGILWNAVFGKIGDPTYNYVEWEGLPNLGARLRKNGIFQEEAFKELKAIAFITTSHSENAKKTIGFYRTRDHVSEDCLKILYRISDFVNDETNSHYWRLKD